jgi:hypothetical protein
MKKSSGKKSGAQNNPRKKMFIVHSALHMGPILQEHTQRYKGGM